LDSSAAVSNVCVLDADITGDQEVGAIAGKVENGDVIVRNVCSTGTVTGTDKRIGGVIGWLKDATLENAWTRAEVQGGNEIGGLVGQIDGGTVRSSYSAGPVSGSGGDIGGLVGKTGGGWSAPDTFWDLETSGWQSSPAGEGRTSEELKDVRTFTDTTYLAGLTTPWDFVDDPFEDTANEDVWNLDSSRTVNAGYPVLEPIDQLGTGAFALVTFEMLAPSTGGTVSPAPGTYTHTQGVTLTLKAVPDVGSGFKLDYWDGDASQPDWLITTITLDTAKTARAFFTGFFAGGTGIDTDPYLIEDVFDLQAMALDRTAAYRLLGDIDASQTSLWAGGAGFLPVGTDANRFEGTLEGNGSVITGLTINRPARAANAGVGLFGHTGNSQISNLCLIDVYIVGDENVGALVGRTRVNPSSLSKVCATGTVIGVRAVGGLIGQHKGTIEDSFAIVDVTGGQELGGLIGRAEAGSTTRAYSAGLVDPTNNSDIGGLIGKTGSGATTTDSYWDTDTSGQTVSAGGTGMTTVQMLDSANYPSWDLVNVWNIDGVTAEGYPFLRVIWP
ncbi:MAG: InlB B-repeat-containing protein, partial [Myxococcota bacterium]